MGRFQRQQMHWCSMNSSSHWRAGNMCGFPTSWASSALVAEAATGAARGDGEGQDECVKQRESCAGAKRGTGTPSGFARGSLVCRHRAPRGASIELRCKLVTCYPVIVVGNCGGKRPPAAPGTHHWHVLKLLSMQYNFPLIKLLGPHGGRPCSWRAEATPAGRREEVWAGGAHPYRQVRGGGGSVGSR